VSSTRPDSPSSARRVLIWESCFDRLRQSMAFFLLSSPPISLIFMRNPPSERGRRKKHDYAKAASGGARVVIGLGYG